MSDFRKDSGPAGLEVSETRDPSDADLELDLQDDLLKALAKELSQSLDLCFHPEQLIAGRFRIVRFLSRGGMGEVYEAEDLRLRERVALKTIRAELAEQDLVLERFRREVRLARKVTHKNVCRLYDLEVHRGTASAQETAVLSMELLHGETLAERLERCGPMGEDEALALLRPMAAGLQAAHEAGVVHRDFKSGNVMLVDVKGETTAVVTDFGLAHALGRPMNPVAGPFSSVRVTPTAAKGAGTPAYMAPEQVLGTDSGTAADLYALGVVLYEMVTGRLPFEGSTSSQVLRQRVEQPAPSPRQLVPNLDPRWDSVILRCLERDPAQRYASALEVLEALTGQTVGRRDQRPRHRWWLGAALMGAVLVGTAVGYGLQPLSASRSLAIRTSSLASRVERLVPRRSVAVLGFKNLSGRSETASLSTALAEMLATELAAGEQLRVISGENVARTKLELRLSETETLGPETLAQLRTNLGADVVVLGSYYAMAGQLRLDVRLQDTAGETIGWATETGEEAGILGLVTRIGSRLRQELGLGALSEAEAVGLRAAVPQNPEAVRWYAEGLEKLRRFDAIGARDSLEQVVRLEPEFALARSALAQAWGELGYAIKAREEAQQAFRLSGSLTREERLVIEGRYREAAGEWERAGDVYRTLFGFFPDHLDYGLRLAAVRAQAGQTPEALRIVEELRKLPGGWGDDPRIDLVEAMGAELVSDAKRLLESASRAEHKAGLRGQRLLQARAGLLKGSALVRLSRLEEADAVLEQARSLSEALGDRAGVARALNSVSNVLWRRGQYAEMQEPLKQALAIARELGDKGSEAMTMSKLGLGFKDAGDLTQALDWFEQEVEILRELGDPRLGFGLVQMAWTLVSLGDLPRAHRTLEEALPQTRSRGDRWSMAGGLATSGWAHLVGGDLKAADAALRQSLQTYQEVGSRQELTWILMLQGQLRAIEGDRDSARKLLEEAQNIGQELGARPDVDWARLELAELALKEGRVQDAEAVARELSQFYAGQGQTLAGRFKAGEFPARLVLVQCLLAGGRTAEARQNLERARALKGYQQCLQYRLWLQWTEGRVLAAEGQPEDALRALETVVVQSRQQGFSGLELESQLALAQLLLKSSPTEGRQALESVRQDAERRGYVQLAHEATVP